MLFTRSFKSTDETIREKFLIQELISFERYCRDHKLWSEMKKCFDENSTVNISWYSGSGWGFVDASEKMKTSAPHKISTTLVWVNGIKAVAECMASIQVRKVIDAATYDLTSYVRLHYKLQKTSGEWYIISLDCIYEKDSLVPAFPTDTQGLCPDDIKDFRPSYASLTYTLSAEGYRINGDLPGDDRPESADSLYAESAKWLDA